MSMNILQPLIFNHDLFPPGISQNTPVQGFAQTCACEVTLNWSPHCDNLHLVITKMSDTIYTWLFVCPPIRASFLLVSKRTVLGQPKPATDTLSFQKIQNTKPTNGIHSSSSGTTTATARGALSFSVPRGRLQH